MGTPRSRGALTKSRKEAEGKLVYRLINDDLRRNSISGCRYDSTYVALHCGLRLQGKRSAVGHWNEQLLLDIPPLNTGRCMFHTALFLTDYTSASLLWSRTRQILGLASPTLDFSALSQPIWLHCNPSPHPSPRTLSSRLGFPCFPPLSSCSQVRSGCWTLLPRSHIPFVSKSRRIWQEIVYYG